MKPSFLNREKPIFTVMLQNRTAEDAIRVIHRAIPEGADAFGLQTEQLLKEYRSEDSYRKIFAEMEGRPSYITNYRHTANEGLDDDAVAEGMLMAARAGGTLIDVMGDMFCRHPEEMTENPAAIDRQKKLIDRIHELGAEVLMSAHVCKYTCAEKVLEYAQEQVRRGADVVKIVTHANDMEQQAENLKTTEMLKRELKAPFLFLSGGECRLHRRIGPMLGCCMWLCVYEHDELATPAQPVLRNLKAMTEQFEKE